MPSPKTSIGLAGAPSAEVNQLNHEETEALRLTALDLTSELELEKLLDKIIKRAVELLKADGGGVYHYDENRELLTVIADCNSGHGLLGNTLRVGEGMAGQIVKNNREMIISDYSQWDGRASKLERGPFHAVVGVPLITRGKTIGVLYVLNYVEGKQFTSRDTHLLSLLASHAAIAIANAEEFEQHKRTLRQLELLNKLNERLSQALNLDQILQITLEEFIKAVRADRGSIMVCDEKTKALETRAWIVQGEMMKGQGHKNFAYGEGIAGYVAVKGEAYNCEDTSKSDLFVKPSSERKIGSLLS